MLEAISKLIESVPVVTEAPSRVGIAPRLSTPLIQKSKPMLLINMDMSRKAIWLLSYYCTPTIEVRVSFHLVCTHCEWRTLCWSTSCSYLHTVCIISHSWRIYYELWSVRLVELSVYCSSETFINWWHSKIGWLNNPYLLFSLHTACIYHHPRPTNKSGWFISWL